MPAELQSLFDTAMGLRVTSLIKGFAEHVTRLDDYRGEHRNHDVLLIGKHGGGPVILGIEAKADEPFDDTIEDKLRKCTNPRSKQPHRVNDLLHALFGRSYNEHPELMLLRYQLLTATAGTLIEAREHVASSAILVVHVFISDKTAPENLQRNDHDLTIFVRTLAKDDSLEVESGRLYGPFHVAGSENVPTLIPLWIGKAVYNCEGPSHCGAAM